MIPSFSCADNTESLLTADAARSSILDACHPITGTEILPLLDVLGRVLDKDIIAPFSVPGHSNAAVDGYALRADDWGKPLPVIGCSLAGAPYNGTLNPGQALQITTGAMIPAGADTVVMQEQIQLSDGTIRLTQPPAPGDNIRLAGEDLAQGMAALHAGRRLIPADIGLLASLGQAEVSVRRRLRVAVFSTGDEVLTLGQPWQAGSIYDSNRYSLLAALRQLGIQTRDLGIVPDNPAALASILAAAQDADVILSSGGVSVGAADYTKDVLARLGQVHFWKIAIKPGRPLAFGRLGNALFFGLPGNPVAVLVTYYQFVLPALYRSMGITPQQKILTIPARCDVALKKAPGRSEFLRGILRYDKTGESWVSPTGQQGSGVLRSMCLANCFIALPHHGGSVAAGEWVSVQPFAGFG